LRTSRRSSPWQRARRGSDVDGETGSGRRWLMAAALWRACSVGEREKGGSAGAQMREGERVGEALGSSGRGRGGCELHARRGRGDRDTRSSGGGYARTRELTARAREQRERGSGRARGESGCADGQARQGRERRGGEGARAGWAGWAERPRGAGVWASFPFSFILAFVFPFPFIYSI
jgi:hypothetical protein